MSIDRNILLFFDASCLIAAAGSPTGGSGFLLSLCVRGLLKVAVSPLVLLEAERDVVAKLSVQSLGRYHTMIAQCPILVVPASLEPELRRHERIVGEKDAHVLAAAVAAQASYLLTLDKGLATRANRASLSILALSPGDFIQAVLPHHVDHPSIRR